MEDCIFCKIANGQMPGFKVAENKDFLAFLDISQFTPGHTLVVPKKHYEFIWDVPNIDKYFEFVKEIGEHYRSLGYKYVDTLTFGRMIPHAHVHLVPHNNNENDWERALEGIGELQLDESRRPSIEELTKISEKFRIH